MARVVKCFICIYAFIHFKELKCIQAQLVNSTSEACSLNRFPLEIVINDFQPAFIWDRISCIEERKLNYYVETSLGDDGWIPSLCVMTNTSKKSICSPASGEIPPTFCGYFRIKISEDFWSRCEDENFQGFCSQSIPPEDSSTSLCIKDESNFSAPLLAASSTVTGTISVGIELPNYEILCYFPVVFINISIAVSTNANEAISSSDDAVRFFDHILQSKIVVKNDTYLGITQCNPEMNFIAAEFSNLDLAKKYVVFATYMVTSYDALEKTSEMGYVEIYLNPNYQTIILVASFSSLVVLVIIVVVLIQTGVITWKKFWNFDKSLPVHIEEELKNLRTASKTDFTSEDVEKDQPDLFSPETDATIRSKESSGLPPPSKQELADKDLANHKLHGSTVLNAVQFGVYFPHNEFSSSSGNTGTSSQPSAGYSTVADFSPIQLSLKNNSHHNKPDTSRGI